MPDLRYYLEDSLGRLDRHSEAERQFRDELELFPDSIRSAAGLAMVFRVTDRVDESNAAIEAMVRRSPTPQAWALAEKLWTMFGEAERAAAARAETRKATAAETGAAASAAPATAPAKAPATPPWR